MLKNVKVPLNSRCYDELFMSLTDKKLLSAGRYPKSSPVKFRGDSALEDGVSSNKPDGLVGGFYDSGNNMKFTFPTAYTVTLLSWSVIEYHPKYADMNELDHVKDIIRWGTDYLLKVFVAPNATSNQTTIYSQVSHMSSRSTIIKIFIVQLFLNIESSMSCLLLNSITKCDARLAVPIMMVMNKLMTTAGKDQKT